MKLPVRILRFLPCHLWGCPSHKRPTTPQAGKTSSLPLTVPHNYPGSGSYSPAFGPPPVPWNGDRATVRDVGPRELQRTCLSTYT